MPTQFRLIRFLSYTAVALIALAIVQFLWY
ncbi:hypothetical protein MOTHE_c18250 [Moorella thermoacetica]|nr:hypothetical protein MOTHE_c18250 [Moorella thermoacetica]AKX97250.1 hypothetical protein MOTHA_c19080 [Moorella thermoacetica]OIQ57331.1 hypothetical protein MOCA_09170 [Moorella thermoacetica]QDA01080.1 hypothetical protein MothHH_01947 [Moorella thermoacetica]TYL10237.1 hypothetical protein MOOCA_08400 [Moorella thermoacetica]